MATISGIAALPASLLGGYIWENYNPALPFWISSIVGLLSASIFFIFVKVPKVRER
jgi:predicted MFS family arabinose efflux permease